MVIWTNGCFDILHRGHIDLFRYARSLGDTLIVGLDDDARVRDTKGRARPINRLEDRSYLVSSLECVDAVVSFGSDEELIDRLKNIQPDIMVVGSDWKGKPIVGCDQAREVKYFNRLDEYSTTGIINRVTNPWGC